MGLINEKNVFIGKYRLLVSKRVIMFDQTNLKIDYTLEKKFPLSLEFEFIDNDESKSTTKISKTSSNNNGFSFKFELINYDSQLGTGLTKPVSIMSHKIGDSEKDISITFFGYKITANNRILEFAIYEEV